MKNKYWLDTDKTQKRENWFVKDNDGQRVSQNMSRKAAICYSEYLRMGTIAHLPKSHQIAWFNPANYAI